MIDFDKGNITLVLVPSDLRAGFDKLSAIALSRLNIDVSKGNDWVVFISKHRSFAKIIHADSNGSLLISRRLNSGRFQELMTRATGPAIETISKEELINYLNGKDLMVKRRNWLKN